ncbi:MAG: holo-ACP synthase [Myxococcales bacterium]|nr:holo-ACP synthase [Myxococcales bacterium]
MTPRARLEVVSVARVDALLARQPGRLARLFTAAEWAYCTERRFAAQHLAARLAAKRASRRLGLEGPFADLEIRRDDRGAPGLFTAGWPQPWQVSLSHDGDVAVALLVEAP